jgi:transposase
LRKAQTKLDPRRLVFIDETSATTKMTPLYGRALRGERLVDRVPHGHWKTTTFIAALRHSGITAPFLLDGPMDGPTFKAYVEQILAPTLKRGDIVFMDRVRLHMVEGVEEAIVARGASVYYLPPYSPDLNPIERAFSKLKAKLRAAEKRTIPELETYLGEVLDCFSPTECENYFTSCGYPAPSTREPL